MTRPRTRPAAIDRTRTIAIALAVCFASAGGALAQQVEVQVARGPHYVGDAVEVAVVAEGFEEEPAPAISAPEALGGTLELIDVSPSVASSITIVNGKMTRSHQVTFVFRHRFVAREPGVARIAPFVVSQGASERATRPLALEVRAVPTSDALALELELPSAPIVVGQKVPIAIELWIDRDLQRDLVSYSVDVPLFSAPELRFLDEKPADANTELQVRMPSGTLLLAARSREQTRDGRRFLVVRAVRTLVATLPGTIDAAPASVVVDQGTQFRRDLFRQRRATASQKVRAASEPMSLVVRDVPDEGRPATFAGAIGRGFTLDVAADRSVVQVGEPIALSFTLRGDGDLSAAGIPRLDAPGLLDPSHFRVPEDSPTGLIDEEGKHFEVMVRVLDGEVREIPSLEYAWFDPSTGRFETTRTRPIALSVAAAEIVGADAVARREGSDAERDASGEPALASETPARAPNSSLALAGANLAVERDVDRLLRDERASGSSASGVAGALYASGFAFLAIGWLGARRRQLDPEIAERRRALARASGELERALALPEREAAEVAARALRAMLARVPSAASRELDALLGELDARSYAPPTTQRSPLSDALREAGE